MREKTTQQLYRYWNSMRGARLAPHRYDIEPARISDILADTLIIEFVDETRCRFRLAGTRVCTHFGQELRGTDFFSLWDASDRDALTLAFRSIVDHCAVALIHFQSFTSNSAEEEATTYELVLLPLQHLNDRVDRFLGAIAPLQTAPLIAGNREAPARRSKVIGQELLWPDGQPNRFAAQLRAGHPVAPLASTLRRARIVRTPGRQFLVYEGGKNTTKGDEDVG